jgi:hypothetical protein
VQREWSANAFALVPSPRWTPRPPCWALYGTPPLPYSKLAYSNLTAGARWKGQSGVAEGQCPMAPQPAPPRSDPRHSSPAHHSPASPSAPRSCRWRPRSPTPARASSMSMNGWPMGKANAFAGEGRSRQFGISRLLFQLFRPYKWSATNVAPNFLPNLLAIRHRREQA